MRKTFSAILILVWLTLISMSSLTPVQARIESTINWIGFTYKGYDGFYNTNVIAYEKGATATLSVTITNDYGKDINVSSVQVIFDWGQTYASTQASLSTPTVIPKNEIRLFSITFTVPTTSNLVLHDYTLIVEHVNSTTDPKSTVETWVERRHQLSPSYYFAIFSTAQTDAQELEQIVSGVPRPSFFNSSEARMLWNQGLNETNVGDMDYERGEFSNAKTHYNTALFYKKQAYETEKTDGATFQNAQIDTMNAQKQYVESQVFGVYVLSILLGITGILLGIGYLVGAYARFETSKKKNG